jgi:DNA modification methylase
MPTTNKLTVVYKDTKDLIPYARNAKIHDDANVNLIAGSIKEFGFNNPVLLDGENGIIAGHGRVLAAQKLGLKQVPTIELQGLTDTEKRAYILADNRLTEKSAWDKEILGLELQDLSELGIDLNTIGFDDADVAKLIPETEIQEDDFEAEPPENPKSQKGDVWILGEHRLMCGDSTSENDVKALMQDEKADLAFTDPPYKLEITGGCKGEIGKPLKKQEKDIAFIADFNPSDFLKVLPSVFSKNTFNAYIFCNKELLPIYLNWAVENKLAFNVLIWKKPSAIPIGDSHRPDIEYLLFFRKNAIWHNALKGVNYSRCLEFGRESGLHPTMKPIGLIANELQISSNKDSVILDCFGGSGSTLIACEQLKRKCRMIELSPHYVDVIIQRWQKLTNKEAVRVDGVKFNDL